MTASGLIVRLGAERATSTIVGGKEKYFMRTNFRLSQGQKMGGRTSESNQGPRAQLRKDLAGPGMVIAPGIYDALGARIVEEEGFKAAYMSGFAVEASYGNPDLGILTLTEVADRAASIADAVDIPIICDADTGYGSAINVIRTVRQFERAGVSAIHIEDQVLPKKCGSFSGKQIISKQEMVGKIKAAVDARTDQEFLIIARTDAFESHGIDEVIARSHAYAEAGADVVFPILPLAKEQIIHTRSSLNYPMMVVIAETPVRNVHPISDLDEMGVNLAVIPLTLLFSAVTAMRRTIREIKQFGTIQPSIAANESWESILKLVRFGEFTNWAETYGDKQRS